MQRFPSMQRFFADGDDGRTPVFRHFIQAVPAVHAPLLPAIIGVGTAGATPPLVQACHANAADRAIGHLFGAAAQVRNGGTAPGGVAAGAGSGHEDGERAGLAVFLAHEGDQRAVRAEHRGWGRPRPAAGTRAPCATLRASSSVRSSRGNAAAAATASGVTAKCAASSSRVRAVSIRWRARTGPGAARSGGRPPRVPRPGHGPGHGYRCRWGAGPRPRPRRAGPHPGGAR